MLSLSVVRSLVLRDEAAEQVSSIAHSSSLLSLSKQLPKWRKIHSNKLTRNNGFPYLVFVPTEEVMSDQLRLAAIARDLGMEFCGDLINYRLIYSWPATGTGIGMAAQEFVSLPFPHLTDARLQQLHDFAKLSRGLFRVDSLPLCPGNSRKDLRLKRGSLGVRVSKESVDDMDKFTRVLAGAGWSVFRIKSMDEMYVYRKVDFKLRLQWDGSNPGPSPAFRARELRLPELDLTSAPIETLEYILLMTDDLFYLNHKPPVTSSRRRSSFSASKMKP